MLKESKLSVFASYENRQILRSGAESPPYSKTKKVIMFSTLSELLCQKATEALASRRGTENKTCQVRREHLFSSALAGLVLCVATNTNLCFLCGWPFLSPSRILEA